MGSDARSTMDSFVQGLISIHAPRVGSDREGLSVIPRRLQFQSTLPVWGATCGYPEDSMDAAISIHAPRVGSDRAICAAGSRNRVISIHAPRVGSDFPTGSTDLPPFDFNPRSPCGERQFSIRYVTASNRISIHAPRVGSDLAGHDLLVFPGISIHAPRVGSDS